MIRSRGPLGAVLPPVPNARELPRWLRDRLHREVSPDVSAYWHDHETAWHIVQRQPGTPREHVGREQLADYQRMATDEGLWAAPAKWRQALYMADGWALLWTVPRFELSEADFSYVRWLLTVPEDVLRAAEAVVRQATQFNDEDAYRASVSGRVRDYLTSDSYVYRRAFRGRVFQRPRSVA